MNLKYVLFDLDGTIADTCKGVTESVAYSLKKFGIRVDDINSLRPFIGPPLSESFSEFYGFQGEKLEEAIRQYRLYYESDGWKACKIYEGIRELLIYLRENGIKICLATSKPEVFAVRILKYYDILQYFDYVGGADMDGIRVKKIDVLKWVTSQIEDFKYEDALMVGDRKYDKTGADGLGIKCVLIEYGFGSREELEKCEPFSIQSTVSDLQKFLDSLIKRG
ncbi:MAG: HAD hydrolase-like protein [Lachnospiraceae bacterium]|nr:HAD hydrolase-like protein [Lachnospiraceae bacterium]